MRIVRVKRLLLTAAAVSVAMLGLTASEAMAAKGAKLTLKKSEYGPVLMNGGGKALYLFTKDTRNRTRCHGDCARVWPPYLTKGKPVAGKGLKKKLVGSIRRPNGRRQVTYRGHPLYFYVHDRPGVILCQDVFEFGGLWRLVDRAGKAVR